MWQWCDSSCLAPPAGGRPSLPQFQGYLPWFLAARPSEGCAKGGMGAYSDALQRAHPDDPTSVAGLLPGDKEGQGQGGRGGVVAASSFRAYYTPLNKQEDFIGAMRHVGAGAGLGQQNLVTRGLMRSALEKNLAGAWVGPALQPHRSYLLRLWGLPAPTTARMLLRIPYNQSYLSPRGPQSREFAARASRELGLRVYSYSLFHVFFEQYLAVGWDAACMVGLPLLAVCAVAWALSGSGWSAALLAGVLGSLLVHLGGAMLLAGIQVCIRMEKVWVKGLLAGVLVHLGGAMLLAGIQVGRCGAECASGVVCVSRVVSCW